MKNTSVIHGTLRIQDLIPAFMDELRDIAPAHYEQLMVQPFPIPPAYAMEDDDSEWWDTMEAIDFLNELYDLLNEHAPDGYYFGAHEGDSSDFGFWEAI